MNEEREKMINEFVDHTINRFLNEMYDDPVKIVEIEEVEDIDPEYPEYGDKAFLDAFVLYETIGRSIERTTFRALIGKIKRFDRFHYKNNLTRDEHPDHNEMILNHAINSKNLKTFFKKQGFSSTTTFGSREDKTYNIVSV